MGNGYPLTCLVLYKGTCPVHTPLLWSVQYSASDPGWMGFPAWAFGVGPEKKDKVSLSLQVSVAGTPLSTVWTLVTPEAWGSVRSILLISNLSWFLLFATKSTRGMSSRVAPTLCKTCQCLRFPLVPCIHATCFWIKHSVSSQKFHFVVPEGGSKNKRRMM